MLNNFAVCEKCEMGKLFYFHSNFFWRKERSPLRWFSLKPIEITNWFCEFQADFYADDIRQCVHIGSEKKSTVKYTPWKIYWIIYLR